MALLRRLNASLEEEVAFIKEHNVTIPTQVGERRHARQALLRC